MSLASTSFGQEQAKKFKREGEGISTRKRNAEMRREGRQHGYVRSQPGRRIINITDKEEDGLKVDSSKPTSQSKFRGKCRRAGCRYCHLEPSSKSRAKTKGLRKHTSTDLLSSYRLCAWKVVMDHNPHGRLSSNAGQSSSDFISFFDRGDDDYLDDDECSHFLTEAAAEAEEVIELIPVQKEEEQREEVDVPEFSSCESDSWTTEILCETDLEEWCLVEEEM